MIKVKIKSLGDNKNIPQLSDIEISYKEVNLFNKISNNQIDFNKLFVQEQKRIIKENESLHLMYNKYGGLK